MYVMQASIKKLISIALSFDFGDIYLPDIRHPMNSSCRQGSALI